MQHDKVRSSTWASTQGFSFILIHALPLTDSIYIHVDPCDQGLGAYGEQAQAHSNVPQSHECVVGSVEALVSNNQHRSSAITSEQLGDAVHLH
jgi:hypothetical protein